MRSRTKASRQGGMFLIEALVALLIVSIGVLGMVGLSAASTSAQSDAQYRTLAAALAGKISQEAWLNVDRFTGADPATRAASLRDTLATFKHNVTGSDCSFAGGASSNGIVTDWAAQAVSALPGATASMQQVLVDVDSATGFNRVTVTVCWQAPSNPVKRQHVLVTYVN